LLTFTQKVNKLYNLKLNKQGKSYCTKIDPLASKNVKMLQPWWVTGYTDAECSFMISTNKTKFTSIGYTVKLVFQM
jgi:hypothetical protein